LLIGLGVLLNLQGGLAARVKSGLREAVAPLQSMVSSGARTIADSVHGVRELADLAAQHRMLSEELVTLRNRVQALEALERENLRLREQLRYAERAGRRLESCEVIARDVSGWWQTVRLGKGYLDGIQAGMAAITPDGLVGKTVDSTPRTADVVLITDPSCKVSVRLPRTGTYGILAGVWKRDEEGRGECRLEFLNKNSEIREGDEVVTSGYGGVFPAGLIVGDVEAVELDAAGLSQTARVRIRADLADLVHLFVVVEERDPFEELLMQRVEEERSGS
jgi:rod shape-determining protein MreC